MMFWLDDNLFRIILNLLSEEAGTEKAITNNKTREEQGARRWLNILEIQERD